MREKIWYEMVHTKYGDFYLSYFLFKQKSIRKWYKILILVFSTGGVFGWTVWDGIPIIACVLIAIFQLFGLIENQILISDREIEKISELRNKYSQYFNKLEKLWIDFSEGRFEEIDATNRFYELRDSTSDMETLDNELHIRSIKSIDKKADLETRNYLNQYHLNTSNYE